VKQLLASGAQLDAVDNNGRTALMQAAFKGRLQVVEQLVASGADTSIRDKEGNTAEDNARLKGATNTADFLASLP